jgi:pimeloyl-ACP methyl ester carboxylesterase
MCASAHPDDVAGIVLVESNHPDEVQQFEAHLTPEQIQADREVVQDNAEGVNILASFDQARRAVDLPRVPLVVVTAGISEGWPPGWDPKLFDRLRAQQQADLAAMVPGGVQMFARNSAHDVPNQQPDVVIDAISKVLAETR